MASNTLSTSKLYPRRQRPAIQKHMLDAGITPPETIISDGQLHRFKIGGKLNGAYVLHLDGKVAGYFEDFKQDIKENWKQDGNFKPLSSIQCRRFAIERQRQEAERNRQT